MYPPLAGPLSISWPLLPEQGVIPYARMCQGGAVRLGIIAACRGGGWTRAKGLQPEAPFEVSIPLTLQSEGSVFIASSSGLENAHETSVLQGSFFTHHVLSNQEGLCERLQQQQQASNSTELTFALVKVGPELEPQGAPTGVYSVQVLRDIEPEPGALLAQAHFHKRDASCNELVDEEHALGYSGTIDFKEPDSNGLAHVQYDISFGSQNDHVTGAFAARLCDITLSSPADLTCQ